MRPANADRRLVLVATTLCLSTLLSALALEVLFRAYCFVKVRSQVGPFWSSISDRKMATKDLILYDEKLGYRYRPFASINKDRPFPVRWRTNSHGHASDNDYPVKKPAGEYRIAVLGDSFTSNEVNTIRWPDELEKELNSRREWRALVGGRRTRVINFGLSGIGFIQFELLARHELPAYEPDLVVVNFEVDDLSRDLYAHGHQTVSSEEDLEKVVYSVRWWRPCSAIIAATVGRRHGMPPCVPTSIQDVFYNQAFNHYARKFHKERKRFPPEESVRKSLDATQSIVKLWPNTVLFNTPEYQEMHGQYDSSYFDAIAQTQVNLSGVMEKFRQLLPPGTAYFELEAAFRRRARGNVDKLYLVPHDFHPSDEGLRAIASEVAVRLMSRQRQRALASASTPNESR
jgi:hypothetical protein